MRAPSILVLVQPVLLPYNVRTGMGASPEKPTTGWPERRLGSPRSGSAVAPGRKAIS
jgi:hypothetical protein